jgi:phosphosulfolactate synthase (CoM biosynthesis protein A)
MKTAVEWLVQQLWNEGYFPYGVPEDIVKKAKEMEKQQIVNAWFGGYLNGEIKSELKSEQYYNETFKSK